MEGCVEPLALLWPLAGLLRHVRALLALRSPHRAGSAHLAGHDAIAAALSASYKPYQ